MKCTPFKICFGMFLLAFVSLFGVSLPVSATNDLTMTLTGSYQTFCDDSDQSLPNCSDYSILRFSTENFGRIYFHFYKYDSNQTCQDFGTTNFYSGPSANFSDTYSDYIEYSDLSSPCKIDVRATGTVSGLDIVATLTNPEQQPTCPDCEVCQVCPAIPENPYDQKLDAIKVAIYVVAGTMLVIYFFYCIYRMIMKGGKF